MRCKHCGTNNAPLKKYCSNCGEFLSGSAINNVTGEPGHRSDDGSFGKMEFQGPGLYFVNVDGIDCQFYASSEDEMRLAKKECLERARRFDSTGEK